MKYLVASLVSLVVLSAPAHAGYDLVGKVTRIQVRPDGALWFAVAPGEGYTATENFCGHHWNGINMYVPADSPQFSYYYGLLMASLLKDKLVLIANISVFNGGAACNITQTGYGVVIVK